MHPPEPGTGGPEQGCSGPIRLPQIVVVGGQKCASTMLAAVLGEHPEIEMAPGELFDFINPNYDSFSASSLARHFSGGPDLQRGFKCAEYLGRPEVPERLAADLPNPHIVVTLREPVRRAISAWYWYVRVGMMPLEDPDAAFSHMLDGDLDRPGYRHARQVLEWGQYGRLLERWFAHFPRQRIYVLYDFDLRADPESQIARVYAGLGVDSSFKPTRHRQSHNAGVYSLARLRWLRVRHRWTWRRGPDGVWTDSRPTRPLPALGNAAVVGIDRYVLSHLARRTPPPLSPSTQERLRDFYRPDIRSLEDLCQVDLTKWIEST